MIFSKYSKWSPFKRGILVVLRGLGVWNLIRQFSLLPGRSFWNNTSQMLAHSNTSYSKEGCKTRRDEGSAWAAWTPLLLPPNSESKPPPITREGWVGSGSKGFGKKAHLKFSVLHICSRGLDRVGCDAQAKWAQSCGGLWLHRSQILKTFTPERACLEHDLALQTQKSNAQHQPPGALPSFEENPDRAWPEEKAGFSQWNRVLTDICPWQADCSETIRRVYK